MTVTAWNPLTCDCGSIEWTAGTEPVSKSKDGYMLPRHCRRCGAPGPDQHVSYIGRSRWSSEPDKKTQPQPPAPKKETNPMAETERAKAPTVQTATSILKERLDNLIPRVVDVAAAKKEAEQVHAALLALGEQLDPLPWHQKKP